jgi:hypothetical protein
MYSIDLRGCSGLVMRVAVSVGEGPIDTLLRLGIHHLAGRILRRIEGSSASIKGWDRHGVQGGG